MVVKRLGALFASLCIFLTAFTSSGVAEFNFEEGDIYKEPAKPLRLKKEGKAIVVAGGRFYTKVMFGAIRAEGSLTGWFMKNPKERRFGNYGETLIRSNMLGFGMRYKVSVIPAGTWVLHDWLGQTNYIQVSPRNDVIKSIGKFTVKPGDVIYIGELQVKNYLEENGPDGKPVPVKPVSLHKDMATARKALKRNYPKFARKLRYKPLKLMK